MPKVSILIPVFNRENYISECISSALAQTFDDFEIIIFDNASSDATWDICKKLALVDSRIRIFRNKLNVGPVLNWLKCLEEAKGVYGKFLFSDDIILPEYLKKTVEVLDLNKDCAFVSTAALIGEKINAARIEYYFGEKKFCASEDYLRRISYGFPELPYSPGAAIFRIDDIRSNLLKKIPTNKSHDFNSNGAGPDVLLFLLTAKSYSKVCFLGAPLVFFRSHAGSFTVQNSNNKVIDGYRYAITWFFENYSKNNLPFFIAKIWLSNLFKSKMPFRISSILEKYSVRDGWGSVLKIFMSSIFIVFRFLIHRIFR